jgi:hypothetical protein
MSTIPRHALQLGSACRPKFVARARGVGPAEGRERYEFPDVLRGLAHPCRVVLSASRTATYAGALWPSPECLHIQPARDGIRNSGHAGGSLSTTIDGQAASPCDSTGETQSSHQRRETRILAHGIR